MKNIAGANIDGWNGWVRKSPKRIEISPRAFKAANEHLAYDLITEVRKKIVAAISSHFAIDCAYPEFTLLTNNLPGDHHVLHADSEKATDGGWVPNHTPNRSHTGMLYLNTGGGKDYTGGEIDFPVLKQKIIPQKGLLVGFKTTHEYMHQVFPIQLGQRFALAMWMTQNRSFTEQWD